MNIIIMFIASCFSSKRYRNIKRAPINEAQAPPEEDAKNEDGPRNENTDLADNLIQERKDSSGDNPANEDDKELPTIEIDREYH